MLGGTFLSKILFLVTAIGVYAFLKLLVKVVTLLLFLLCYYVVDMLVLIITLFEMQSLVSD